tara:strand:- start:119 stop:592 length:474 start_codon:yes stop_codon:yes gene_type:complete
MKKKIDFEEYEGDLWVIVNEEGLATQVLTEEPSLAEKQGFVGGLIEYAPVVKGATAPIPKSAGQAKMSEVISVIVDEEGLLKNKTPNTIATYAAFQEPFSDETRQPLVGSAILHLNVKKDDAIISFEEMLQLVSGNRDVREGFWLHGIHHYTDGVMA